jgi:integrase
VRPGRGTHQGIRDHAAITVLWGSGLRGSEMRNLNHEQYTRRGLTDVLSKGGRIRDFVPVQAQARQVLDEGLTLRGDGKGALFTTRSGERVSRMPLFLILPRVDVRFLYSLPPCRLDKRNRRPRRSLPSRALVWKTPRPFVLCRHWPLVV